MFTGKGDIQIYYPQKSNARIIGLEKAVTDRNFDARSNEGTEAAYHIENRLGKQVKKHYCCFLLR